MKKNVFLLPIFILLSACIIAPPVKIKQQPWHTHVNQINRLNHWKITGKLSATTIDKSGIATIYWQQNDAAYRIRLLAPFNQASYEIHGNNIAATIYTGQKVLFKEQTLTALLQERLGWDIDAASLIYWVKGIPNPQLPLEQLILNKDGLISMMRQQDMRIEISHYQDVDGVMLPKKMLIKNKNITLKILIKNWEI